MRWLWSLTAYRKGASATRDTGLQWSRSGPPFKGRAAGWFRRDSRLTRIPGDTWEVAQGILSWAHRAAGRDATATPATDLDLGPRTRNGRLFSTGFLEFWIGRTRKGNGHAARYMDGLSPRARSCWRETSPETNGTSVPHSSHQRR
jgi:hypothetical protein